MFRAANSSPTGRSWHWCNWRAEGAISCPPPNVKHALHPALQKMGAATTPDVSLAMTQRETQIPVLPRFAPSASVRHLPRSPARNKLPLPASDAVAGTTADRERPQGSRLLRYRCTFPPMRPLRGCCPPATAGCGLDPGQPACQLIAGTGQGADVQGRDVGTAWPVNADVGRAYKPRIQRSPHALTPTADFLSSRLRSYHLPSHCSFTLTASILCVSPHHIHNGKISERRC